MTAEEQLGALRADGNRRGVRFERYFEAPPAEVWSALTDPERLRSWLADSDVDLRVGGRVEFRMGEGEDSTSRGAFREVEPERVLEYEWHWPGETESVVRWELTPQGTGTLVVLDHRRLPPEAAPGYGAGWHAYLDLLGRHLEGRSGDWNELFQLRREAYSEQAASLT